MVVSDVPFLRTLPSLNERMIYTVAGPHGRMAALRAMIRQLERGGAVVIFPTGLVDPDPDVLPGAAEKLTEWSPSLETALRRVPDARLLPTIVSGVLSEINLRSPLLLLQREEWRRRKLAEFLQVLQQLAIGRSFHLRPRLSFGEPVSVDELAGVEAAPDDLGSDQVTRSASGGPWMPAIVAAAHRLLEAHMRRRPTGW